jgi:hypothetical protein
MGLQSLISRLQDQVADTSVDTDRYPAASIFHANCTLDTSDTLVVVGSDIVDTLPSDADRWCWPHSTAMNGLEIEAFTARVARFAPKGQSEADAESIADKLVRRDREVDGRRLCLECRYLDGNQAGSWRCGNPHAFGVANRERNAQLPRELVVQLQRCGGFSAHLNLAQESHD